MVSFSNSKSSIKANEYVTIITIFMSMLQGKDKIITVDSSHFQCLCKQYCFSNSNRVTLEDNQLLMKFCLTTILQTYYICYLWQAHYVIIKDLIWYQTFAIIIQNMKPCNILFGFAFLFFFTTCSYLYSYQAIVQTYPNDSLKFDNGTGKGITEAQLKSFIEIANYASFVYGDNVEKTAKYIKLRMDSLYGKPNFNFYVFIQTEQVISGRVVWVLVESVYASFYGINKYYPKWSYFFVRNLGSNLIEQYAYFSLGQKGTGLSLDLVNLIRRLIEVYQPEDECKCSRDYLVNISNGIYERTSQTWSVICDNKGVTHSLIRSYEQKWISTQGRHCYYTIYS